MQTFLIYSQIALSSLFILLVLVQDKSSGLGAALGGTNEILTQKRGAEKILHYATIIIAIILVLNSIASVAL